MSKRPPSPSMESDLSSSFSGKLHLDPVDVFLGRSNSRQEALTSLAHINPPPLEKVTVEGIRQLATSLAWGAVLECSGAMLQEEKLLTERTRLEVITFRVSALIQTRQIDRAEDQISALSEDVRNRFLEGQVHPPIEGEVCTPFELRALSADILSRRGSPKAFEIYYELKAITEKQLKIHGDSGNHEGLAVWQCREQVLLSALAAYHLRLHQPDSAVDITRELIRQYPKSAVFRYALVRILIHAGRFKAARRALSQALKMSSESKVEGHIHRGLILVAEGEFDAGLDEFEIALVVDPSNVPAANNAAICLLQMGRLEEAIERLEESLRGDAVRALDEGLVFNLCTLYDLSQPGLATDKKAVIRKLAARFGRQGFNMDAVTI